MSPDRGDRDVASTARPGSAGEGGAPALVGRSRERTRLGQLLDETREGHGSAWLLSGPAGVGKTVLLGWVRAHAAGMRVLDHVCFETDSQHAFCTVRELVEALEPTI
jgi:ATP/maltotriose-dependent transcriptional regulator MalT